MSDLAISVSTDPDYCRWVEEIDRYEQDSRRWYERSKKIVKRYKDDRDGPSDENAHRYNILWSSLQVLIPAVYAKNPVPQVERRYKDEDPVGRQASEVLERCINWCMQAHAFKDTMRCSILDRFLPGRGLVWVRYVPHFKDASVQGGEEVENEGDQVTDDADEIAGGKVDRLPGDMAADEVLDFEECIADYVHWEDFGHTVGRTWNEVRAVWRIAYLTRQECIDRFGEEIGAAIPLTSKQLDRETSKTSDVSERQDKAVIYEIWDKVNKEAIWICKDYKEGCLDIKADPLHLSGFFPCPRPLFATLANDTLIPVPDYVEYQDQANELDELSARIAALTKAIKVAGVYDASQQALERMLSEGTENQLIPVDSWAAFAEKGGIKGSMELLPLDDIVKGLLALHDARDKVKQDLYEITGLSDILRGANDPAETATATRMKGAFASIRLREIQDEVSRFSCDVIKIMGEIIAHHFGQDTLSRMSGINLLTQEQKMMMQMQFQAPPPMPGQPPAPPAKPTPQQVEQLNNPTWEEVVGLLKNDATRNFRIDIETDSTIADDEEQDKAERLEFLETIGKYIQQLVAALQTTPQIAPLLGEMLMFAVRGFKIGRTLENAMEAALEQMEQLAQNPPPPKPDPAQIKAQTDIQLAQQKAQSDTQAEQMRVQGDIAIAKAKAQADMQVAAHKATLDAQVAAAAQAAQERQSAAENALEARRDAMQQQLQAHQEAMRMQFDAQAAKLQQATDLLIARLNNAAKIEMAEVTAQATLDAAETSAAASASQEGGE